MPTRAQETEEDLHEFIRKQLASRADDTHAPWCPTRNLLIEIAEILEKSDMTVDQIACVTNKDDSDNIDVRSFLETARRFEYDPRYGSEKVPSDLVLLLCDGTWLERVTDDGAEWFEHRKLPLVQTYPRTISDWDQAPYAAKQGTATFFR